MRTLPLTVLVLTAAACAAPLPATTPGATAPLDTAPTTVTRAACQVPYTPDVKRAVAGTRISGDEGDEVLAVDPAGEVLANLDDELRLIQPNGTTTTAYEIPDPRLHVVNAEIDERWIVLGLDDGTTRVVDRRDGSARSVPARADDGSPALRDGTLYWITHPIGQSPDSHGGTLHSFDLGTSVSADVATGAMLDLRATATGLSWATDFYDGPRVFHGLQPIPAQLASVPGIDADQISLVRDGDAYAWITGVAEGGTGVARWAPDTGLTRIATARLFGKGAQVQPSVHLAGPYVALGRMEGTKDYAQDVLSVLVDTRSGALLSLHDEIVGGGGGTLAIQSGTIQAGRLDDPFALQVLRADAMPQLSCTSSEDAATTRPSCEMTLPAAWRKALTDGEIHTGGKTRALAVGPDGVVAVSHDEAQTHELLLRKTDHSERRVYRVANPDRERIEFAALGERWIVVGVVVDYEDGQARPLTRVDVIDRRDDSVRTIAQITPDAEQPQSGQQLYAAALFGDTVYWITGEDGRDVVMSQALESGAVAEVGRGQVLRQLQVTPVGVAWQDRDLRTATHVVADLPALLVAAGVRPDDDTLVSDGVAYAWVTDTGVGHWSPDAGVTQVRLEKPWYGLEGELHVAGPYVVLRRPVHQIGRATVVDGRTGGVVSLDDRVVATGGGSMAVNTRADLEDYSSPSTAGVVRIADLPPLTC
ncbi:hypothetical protein [Mycobacterium sp. NPDC006124]|uniref:hypothetical protein n=1 Tax=Mycobacterium sp. NPDC006124 TaxID=3156729 RepID=UPI0033A48F1C